MQVKIIRMTENPIDAIASAYAITRGLSYEEYLMSYATEDKKLKLIRGCYDSGHMSGFEFVDVDIEVLGCSRVFEADKIRSRISSYEVEAGKFTDQRDFETVVPTDYSPAIAEERISVIREWNAEDKAKGIDPRNRRYWTHQGLSRRMRISCNLRSVIETGWNRICSTAQWEYKLFYKLLRAEINNISPFFAEFIQPKCEHLGYCPEMWEPCEKMPTKAEALRLYKLGLEMEKGNI